jgi:hypothetical protein
MPRKLFEKHSVDHYFVQFSVVVKVLAMIVIIFMGAPVVEAICFRLLLPLFTVDMPCRHAESHPFVKSAS